MFRGGHCAVPRPFPPNKSLELTGLSCAKTEADFAIVVGLPARLLLQSRPAAQPGAVSTAHRYVIRHSIVYASGSVVIRAPVKEEANERNFQRQHNQTLDK